jgi:2-polyprenyl-6-methoxyphenol hydroxylase-like FAD-dependent oxidoreductase
MDDTPRIAIAGAGIGGLALAQGLRAAGLDVQVYERDPAPDYRRQGYRIHISPVGEQALTELLPEAVHRRAVETATHPGDLLAGFTTQMKPMFEQVFPVTNPRAITSIDRYAFRRALMTGLDDILHFGHEIEDFAETADGRVEIRFAGGRDTVADVLVGADGVTSSVRARLLPEFDLVDIGIRCIYGKLHLTDAVRNGVPPQFLRGFCFVQDPAGIGGGFAPVLFRERPAEYGDYLMTVMTGSNKALGHSDDELFSMRPEDLWAVAVERTRRWHPSVHQVMAGADASAAFPITLRTCTRIDPWRTGRVTLLGDAVHPMTPAAGAGANTALWDSARLARALKSVGAGRTIRDALAEYERDMIEHGMAAVTESLHGAQRLFGTKISELSAPTPSRRS